MMETMEDGELTSSSEGDGGVKGHPLENPPEEADVLDDSNYVIIERPKSSLPVAASSKQDNVSGVSRSAADSMSAGGGGERQDLSHLLGDAAFYESYGKKAYFDRSGVSDLIESSDKDSSSDSDSDDGGTMAWKRSRNMNPGFNYSANSGFSNPNAGMPNPFGGPVTPMFAQATARQEPGQNNFFAEQAAKFQKQRKTNSIWSDVIQEEEISKGMGHNVRVGGGYSEVEVTRGPETYFFQRPTRTPRQRRESDSSDISSEGLSDNALHYLKDGIENVDEEETGEESSEHSLPKSFTAKSASSSRKSKRRSSQKHKKKIVGKLRKMKSPDLAKYMANKLQEHKVELLARVIETLGKDKCIHTFLKTLKIEKRGGIMVKSQERRRTPGGVFLYLIRGDRRVPKSAIDAIFRDEMLHFAKVKKMKVASKRLTKKAALESALHGKGGDQSESQSDTATAVPDACMEGEDYTTDTGLLGDDSSVYSSRDATADEMSGLGGMQFDGPDM